MNKNSFDRISDIARMYRKSQTLFSAFELGILDLLQHEHSLEELCKAHNFSIRGCKMLLDALISMDIIEKQNSQYKLCDDMMPLFDHESEDDMTGSLKHEIHLSKRWRRLSESIKSGEPQKKNPGKRTPAEAKTFIGAMKNVGQRSAMEFLKKIHFKGNENLLDLGGGPGMYVKALAEKYPEMKLTLFDQKDSIKTAQKLIKNKNVTFKSGDFLKSVPGNNYDVIIISNVIHIYGEHELGIILNKCFDKMSAAGRLLIKDFLFTGQKETDLNASIFALHMLLSTHTGKVFYKDELKEIMEKSGFTFVNYCHFGKDSYIMEGRRDE